ADLDVRDRHERWRGAGHEVQEGADDVVGREPGPESGEEVVAVDLEAEHGGDAGEAVTKHQAPAGGASRARAKAPGHPDAERPGRVDRGGELGCAVPDDQ